MKFDLGNIRKKTLIFRNVIMKVTSEIYDAVCFLPQITKVKCMPVPTCLGPLNTG